MPKQINYQLETDELITFQRAIVRDKRAEVRHRATAIHLLHQDKTPQEVAEMLAVTVGSIYKWHQRWRTQGLDGLADLPCSGAPPKADEVYWQRLADVLGTEPQALGYPFTLWITLWTAQRLAAHMAKETGVQLSISRLRTVLRARGYVYRRPKHDLTRLQEPLARTAAEAWLQELKKEHSLASSSSSLWMKPH